MIIETERLILRELEPSDYDALYKVLADSDIKKHYPYTFDEKRVQNRINKKYRTLLSFRLRSVGCLPKKQWGDDR